ITRGRIAVVCEDAFATRLRSLVPGVEVVIASAPDSAPADVPLLAVGGSSKTGERIAYAIPRDLPDELLAPLVTALATGTPVGPAPSADAPANADEARRAQAVFTASRRVAAASDAAETERVVVDAIMDLLDVDRAACLF